MRKALFESLTRVNDLSCPLLLPSSPPPTSYQKRNVCFLRCCAPSTWKGEPWPSRCGAGSRVSTCKAARPSGAKEHVQKRTRKNKNSERELLQEPQIGSEAQEVRGRRPVLTCADEHEARWVWPQVHPAGRQEARRQRGGPGARVCAAGGRLGAACWEGETSVPLSAPKPLILRILLFQKQSPNGCHLWPFQPPTLECPHFLIDGAKSVV